jgi:DNA-binding transcriptional LysR family regulator
MEKKNKIDLEDLEIFCHVVNAGSLSAGGRELGLSSAVISRRLQKLEKRLGVRLLQRTTRRLAQTEIGIGYYERCAAALAAVEEAEAFVRGRAPIIRGTLKVSAPTSFGRLHIAPWLKGFTDKHPDLSLHIDLSDAFANVVAEGLDLAIRISSMRDSALAARKLTSNHRVICASPEYLKKHGTPRSLRELKEHRTLAASNHTTWLLDGPNGKESVKVVSAVVTNSSDLVREGTLAGLGVALRSTWDVGPELKMGRLKRILPQYRGSSDVAIYAVYPSSRLVPLKVRAFVDYLARTYGPEPYWDEGLTD